MVFRSERERKLVFTQDWSVLRRKQTTGHEMSKAPVIELTDDGKTLVALYPSLTQGLLVSRFLTIMGEPEMICPGEDNAETIFMLFPHQDMPEELREAAEEMTTALLLDSLGYSRPEGGNK